MDKLQEAKASAKAAKADYDAAKANYNAASAKWRDELDDAKEKLEIEAMGAWGVIQSNFRAEERKYNRVLESLKKAAYEDAFGSQKEPTR